MDLFGFKNILSFSYSGSILHIKNKTKQKNRYFCHRKIISSNRTGKRNATTKKGFVKVTNVFILGLLKSQTDLEWKEFCVSCSLRHKSKKPGHIQSSILFSPSSQLPIILRHPKGEKSHRLGGYKVADRGFPLGLLPQKPVFFSSTFHHHVGQSS